MIESLKKSLEANPDNPFLQGHVEALTSAKEQADARRSAAACSLVFTANRPTKAGGYWMACDETDNVPEWVNVFWKYGKLMAEIDCGTFAVADVCGGLTDVKWSHAISITENAEVRHGAKDADLD